MILRICRLYGIHMNITNILKFSVGEALVDIGPSLVEVFQIFLGFSLLQNLS